MSGAESVAPRRRRRNGGAEMALPCNNDTNLNHFTFKNFTELIYLSYLHYHRIKVLSSQQL